MARRISLRGARVGVGARDRGRTPWGRMGLLAGLLALTWASLGCASSSSDTPWPELPDFERLRFEAKQQRAEEGGQEWSPREPEGDEPGGEESPPISTWGTPRAVDEPPPLRAGTPRPSAPDPDDDDEIDSDPFFQDDPDED